MIDLRSDTVTRPSTQMRQFMAEAEVGDDVFSEDPTVLALELETAELLGKEAALYTPSGCMANQLALNVHAGGGDEVIVEGDSHIFNYETTAASYLSRIQLHPIYGEQGMLTAQQVRSGFREKAYYMPVTKLVALENTHNRAGGTVYPVSQIAEVAQAARDEGVAMHLDGARLWNACTYSGLEPIDYAQHFDTVAVCFSKGLGAPVGSCLTGPKDLIEKARRMRKIWGGGMRQAGVIAAGALYALRNNRGRLVHDHDKARQFAEIIIKGTPNIQIDQTRVQTNIILLTIVNNVDLDAAIAQLCESGVLLSKGARGMMRAVTHMDVTMEECIEAANKVVEVFA